MANSKQAGSSSRMTMEEYRQLSSLLKRASNENRLGEVMVFANIEDAAATQLQTYLHPVVGAKAKAKAKAPSQMGGHGMATGSGGAMTDASKRRLDDDLASMAASEGWEDIEVLSSYAEAERAIWFQRDMWLLRRLVFRFQVRSLLQICLSLMFRGILPLPMMIWMAGIWFRPLWTPRQGGEPLFACARSGRPMNGPMST